MPDTRVLDRPGVSIPLCISPEQAFAAFSADPHTAWLDSAGPLTGRSSHSYLATDPFEVFTTDVFARLAAALRRFAQPAALGRTPFIGGAIGFLAYEFGATLERIPRHPAPPGLPDASIGLYDVILAFDRRDNTAWLHASGLPETNQQRRAARATARAQATLNRLAHANHAPANPPALIWEPETPRALHEARIARTIAYIEAGDIYQANITAAFHAARPAAVSPADIHAALRAASPAPFGAFLGLGQDYAIASVSPERFLSLNASGAIEARPIKGTRPRHPDPATDAALLAELLASPKDHAENLMIVDLLRHDISRVAEIGSVQVSQLATAETFANVHHLVSAVHGQLRPGATALDLLRAAFPGGSITGAPKRRAQQIIHELEPAARGPYCGTVFWLGWDGAMDSSIAIRTAAITPDWVTIQAGGGIVADSDPAAEYEEMLVKARPLLRALGSKEGLLF